MAVHKVVKGFKEGSKEKGWKFFHHGSKYEGDNLKHHLEHGNVVEHHGKEPLKEALHKVSPTGPASTVEGKGKR